MKHKTVHNLLHKTVCKLPFVQESKGVPSTAITLPWVQQNLVKWKPATNTPVNITLQATRLSYNNPLSAVNTSEVIAAELAFLDLLQPDTIRIDLGYDAYVESLPQLAAIDIAVKTIPSTSLILADAGREYYHSHPVPWSQFQTDWISRVTDLASRYQPAYYIVIKEPGWYVPMISDTRTNPAFTDPNSWITLLDELCKAVKSMSPNTKTGMSIAMTGNQTVLLADCLGVQRCDFVGFDLYSTTDYDTAQSFLVQNSLQGKALWLAELWTTSFTPFALSRAALDAVWVPMAYDFALHVGAVELNYFYSDCLCDYMINTLTDPAIVVADYQVSRTPAYTALQGVVATG